MKALWVGLGLLAASCAHFNRAEPRTTAPVIEAAPAVPEETATFKVVTYNLHGEPAGPVARALSTTRAIRGADWVLLQEVEAHPDETAPRAVRIARLLGMGAVYAPGYGLGDGGSHGVALLSRYPLKEIRIIELPRKFVVINSARRVAIGATAMVGGLEIRIYSVHLDNRLNPAERREQLGPVIDDAKGYFKLPTIIAGDVNTSPFCWALHLLPLPCAIQDDRLESFVRRHGFDTPVVGSGPTSPFLDMRLDAIYTRGFEVYEYGVARRVKVSDHLPLWAQMRLAGR
ncbi:MAG: endonuclease/exonuclease/phosphatase family protein [Deltaproteobacteria bacterium]|nr:endonuclease/exonuclease/phosphatase family protein [Deltaproteobacteria bacterium]